MEILLCQLWYLRLRLFACNHPVKIELGRTNLGCTLRRIFYANRRHRWYHVRNSRFPQFDVLDIEHLRSNKGRLIHNLTWWTIGYSITDTVYFSYIATPLKISYKVKQKHRRAFFCHPPSPILYPTSTPASAGIFFRRCSGSLWGNSRASPGCQSVEEVDVER